jgi:hypothetical protein
MAALLLAVALAAALLAGALLAGALLAAALLAAGLLLALVLALLQPARTAAATTAAAHSTLHPLAVMTAGCKTPVRAASPARGEGKRAPRSREKHQGGTPGPVGAAVRDQPRKAVR